MIKHFDFFRFYNLLLVIACDKEDKVIGYFCLRDGNEFCNVYVAPSHRGTGVVHLLVWEAVEILKSLGFPTIWGLFYTPLAGLYNVFKERFGAVLLEENLPETRPDGQYRRVYDITTITPDKRPRVKGEEV
jgi:GNAT superfamily N-acetyltransferase